MKRTGAVNTSSKGKKSLSFNQKKNKTKPKAVSQVHRPASKPYYCFVFINGTIYTAATTTYRHNYQYFEEQVKLAKANEKQRGERISRDKMQNFVRALTVHYKMALLKTLEEEIDIKTSNQNPHVDTFVVNRISPMRDTYDADLPRNGDSRVNKLNGYGKNIKPNENKKPNKVDDLEELRKEVEKSQSNFSSKDFLYAYESEGKLSRLQEKLRQLKYYLIMRWSLQVYQINRLFLAAYITLASRDDKLKKLAQVKDNKLRLMDYTQGLFYRILKEDNSHQEKEDYMGEILLSLNSFPSFGNEYQILSGQGLLEGSGLSYGNEFLEASGLRETNAKAYKYTAELNRDLEMLSESLGNQQDSYSPREKSQIIRYYNSENDLYLKYESPVNEYGTNSEENEQYRRGEYPHTKSPYRNNNYVKYVGELLSGCSMTHNNEDFRNSLRLYIRLDEVTFGKDSYDDDTNENSASTNINQKEYYCILYVSPINDNGIHSNSLDGQNNLSNDIIYSPKYDFQRYKSNYVQKMPLYVVQPLKVPPIMTSYKVYQMEIYRNTQELERINEQLTFRKNIQTGDIDPVYCPFTSMVAVNAFIIGFYEFLLRTCEPKIPGIRIELVDRSSYLIDRMNYAVGKSVYDKLFSLKQYGTIDIYDVSRVLQDQHLLYYHLYLQYNGNIVSLYEGIHNQAVFDLFNISLNVYRPYFYVNGEVYPWIISEKALAFYYINEENIEEVFEKSKVKVLEACNTLCGLLVDPMPVGEIAKTFLANRTNEILERDARQYAIYTLGDWSIELINHYALERLQLSDIIFEHEISLCILEFSHFCLL